MDLQLAGKRALITGASKGIGYACALALAREGATPILVARSAAGLATAAQAILTETGMTVETVAVDMGAADAPRLLYSRIGEVDVLINNAGAIPRGSLGDIDDLAWRSAWDVKLYGTIGLTRVYRPCMERRKSGVIVNIIGMAGVANRDAYLCGSTANAALMAFTRAAGAASTRYGVRIFGINPSLTRTDRAIAVMSEAGRVDEAGANLPFGRMMEPDEVASLAVFGCSPLAGYLSGTVIDLDGGQLYSDSV